VLIASVIGFALSGAASFVIAHYWEARNAQTELDSFSENRRLLLQNELTDLVQMITAIATHFHDTSEVTARPEFPRIIAQASRIFSPTFEIDWVPRVLRHNRS
jgi:hypothetical protein